MDSNKSGNEQSMDQDYGWVEPWGEESTCPPDAWSHGDLVVTDSGKVITFDAKTAALLTFAPDGKLLNSFATDLHVPHGVSIDPTVADRLWVADIGMAATPDAQSENGWGVTMTPGRVVQLGLDGATLRQLPLPSLAAYETSKYIPTDVVSTASGDVWVADGYGASLVHRFDASGDLVATLDGEELGIGKFSCPHGLLVDDRGSEPHLIIADRGNKRLVVVDLDGGLVHETGVGLTSPSALAMSGELLVVAELNASVALLDRDGTLIGRLGDASEVCARPSWPNQIDVSGQLQRPDLEAGRFNSPHGIAVDAGGNLYVTEWLIGGRLVQLPTG